MEKTIKCHTPSDTETLVESAATAILAGRSAIRMGARTGPPTPDDLAAVAKLAGIPAEEFLQRMSAKLQTLADLTAERIEEKLVKDCYKPAELSFLLAVTLDKLAKNDARSQPAGAVNIQINHFGSPSARKEILGSLMGSQNPIELGE